VDTQEEAALVRRAVLGALGDELSPRFIADLGGGSLEINLLRGNRVELGMGLPLGTVRLMETYNLHGAISEDDARKLRAHILAVLESSISRRLDLSNETAVLCGGNAEALALLAPGPHWRGIHTLNLRLLRERQWDILSLNSRQRMKRYHVRPDRADVMGIATVLFVTLARWANLARALVPGVGVRHGLIRELAEKHFSTLSPPRDVLAARTQLEAVRDFGERLRYDAAHADQVRRLATSMFDQLRPVHGMGSEERLLLEFGAQLHDVGRVVNEEGHHKHGEYLVRHAELHGLRGWRREFVACLVRYHNRRTNPDVRHKLFASLDTGHRKRVRALAALLRLAEGLERSHENSVVRIDVETSRREAHFRVHLRKPSPVPLRNAERRAELFEEEFGLKATFSRAVARPRATAKR
jgi:exopolyphosphatase/guanosine-5'-triphosphate,3'-diphosphate pyrophosphatase